MGRSVELARLGRLVDEVCAGRAGAVMVVGEAGIGKTRLLSEAAGAARERGVVVADSRCLPLTTALPFDPILALLRRLGDPLRLPSGHSPREMFGEVLGRLEVLSMAGPLLLCVDDLQWSDLGTLELLHYSLARLSDSPIGWLLAARPAAGSGLLAHRLQRGGLVERITLGPLSPGETRLLAEGVLGAGRVSDQLREVVYGRTGGNPFLCEELLRTLPMGDPDEAGEPSSALAQVVPAGVTDAVRARFEGLSAGLRSALEWASVLPVPFTVEELAAVGGPEVGAAPEALADAGFLVRDQSGGWGFVHSLLHDAVYRELPELERLRRHGVVADAITAGPLERLAPQLVNAGRAAQAACAYLELAQIALDRGQGQDALRLYELAHELARREPGADPHLRDRADGGRVIALLRSGDSERARREASVLRVRLRDRRELEPRLRFLSRFATELMLIHGAADIATAREALSEAEPLLAQAGGPLLAQALTARAWLLLRTGQSTQALADAERAAELAASEDDAELEVSVLNVLGLAVGMTRSAIEGITVLKRALERALAANLPLEAGRACANLAFLAEYADDIAAIEGYSRRGLGIGGILASTSATLHANLGVARSLMGDLNGALAHHLAARNQALRTGSLTQTRVAGALAYVHIWRGELAAAQRLLETHGLVAGNPDDARAPELWGLLLEAQGAWADALASYRQGTEVDDPNSMWCEAGVARTAVAVGDLATVRVSLERLERLVGRWPVGEWMLQEACGWLTAAEERTGDAIAHFQAAAEGCSRAYDTQRLRLEAARLARNREQLLSAIDAFEQMGAARAADHARAIARSIGMRPGRRHHRSGVLSAREQEVAQLVAAGQTNAEIAAALFLSPRTVERHVGSILTKLGYRSRVQIAAQAAGGNLPGVDGRTEPAAAPGTRA